MSKRRSAENWDSDEELLDDTPGISNYAKSEELDVLTTEGELEDEDALLSLENDTSQANAANHSSEYYNAEQDHTQDEQAFVFEDVDTGDLEDELNVGGEEESGYQEQVYQGDGDYVEGYHEDEEGYHEEAGVDSSEHAIAVDGGSGNIEVAVSYEQAEDEPAVELQYDEQHDSEREIVLQYGDSGDGTAEAHDESNQPAAEHESESDSDDEDSRNNRGRFKTERTGVISLATSKERTSIPDTLEINDEQAEQINKFMLDKAQPAQRGGKKPNGGRGGRPNVHSRLGSRSGMGPRPGMGPQEAQGPGMIQGPRAPFPLGLPGPINPRMLMGIIRGGGMQALRGMLPPGLGLGPRGPMSMRMGRPRGPMPPDGLGPRGPFPDGPQGQRGPFSDGPPGQRGPFPMRPGGPGGMNMRGRMPGPPGLRGPPGPRGPGDRGPFPPGPQPRGPFPGPRGPPLPFPPGVRMGPPGPGGPLQQRLRGPGPGQGPGGMMIRGQRGPSPRPLIPNDGPPPGMLRSPSPMRSPDPSNRGGPSIHDRLGPKHHMKAGMGRNNSQASESPKSEGQPIPSLVKPVSAPPNLMLGMNQGSRPSRPQMNVGFRQPNPRGPRALMTQNVTRPPVGGPNKIFINPRFQKPEEEGPTGITRTVRIGVPLQQRRAKALIDRAKSNIVAKVPVVATKRRSDGGGDVPNKFIRMGDNQQGNQDQQYPRTVVDEQNQRNVVQRDGVKERPGFVKRNPLGRRLGPQGPSQAVHVPVKRPSSNSSVQSRLGPPISRRNESNILLTSSSQQMNFNPNVAPPNLPPRGPPPNPPPRQSGPPPPSATMFSKPPPSMTSIRGPPPPVPASNRFASPPPGSATPPRYSGPPPSAAPPSSTPRYSAPPPAINVAQPPPGFTSQLPPRFQAPVSQQPPTFHPTPPSAVIPAVYHPPPTSPHYPPPAAAVVAIPTYTQPPPAQAYTAPPPAVAPALTGLPPPAAAYQPPPGYPSAPPSSAQPYQHIPAPAPAAVAYKPPVVATTSYQPPHQPAPTTQQYSLDYYSASRSQYQAPAATQSYQSPHSSYYNYSSSHQHSTSTKSTRSPYESQDVHHITTIGRRAQPATDSQVRSILHNVAPSRSSSSGSQSYSSDRVVVDTNVSVLKGPQKVAIYNLAQMATKETLVKVCRHFGRVLNVQLFRELNKAIVEFETGDQAAKCVSKCDQKCLHKSRLTVKLLPD